MTPDFRPRASVLVPLYNMREYVEEGLRSVIEQDLEGVEIVVVDDGSTDGSGDVVARLADETVFAETGCVIRCLRQKNQGKPVALNRALRTASAPYVTVLDPDDRLPEASLSSRYRRALQANAEMVVGEFEVVRSGEVTGRRSLPDYRDPGQLRRRFYLSISTPFHFNSCLIARTLVERVGEFDVRLRRCQDGDYAIRCLDEAHSISWLSQGVYLYRKHRSTVRERWRFRIQTAQNRPLVLIKNFGLIRGGCYAVLTAVIDAAKLVYETFGHYET